MIWSCNVLRDVILAVWPPVDGKKGTSRRAWGCRREDRNNSVFSQNCGQVLQASLAEYPSRVAHLMGSAPTELKLRCDEGRSDVDSSGIDVPHVLRNSHSRIPLAGIPLACRQLQELLGLVCRNRGKGRVGAGTGFEPGTSSGFLFSGNRVFGYLSSISSGPVPEIGAPENGPWILMPIDRRD